MTVFDELGDLYNEMDNTHSIQEIQARTRGFHKKESEYSRKRQLNDQSYFLFMFTRLEDRIRTLSENLIDYKVATLTNWKNKRTWDILYKRKDNIPLMDRVALLTKINGANYRLINNYYKQRNSIGHGGVFTIPINISMVITDFKRLYSELKE